MGDAGSEVLKFLAWCVKVPHEHKIPSYLNYNGQYRVMNGEFSYIYLGTLEHSTGEAIFLVFQLNVLHRYTIIPFFFSTKHAVCTLNSAYNEKKYAEIFLR